ncbi:hypothetical protein CWRG_00581 [Chthonomonas calidirosea]|uniref:DUF6785 family protein n=1 Tax=Chthonomonas calidirosea TaxID=454171 RepID=UPI0006DD42C2|nr:DUF6785 family protein [Chthonomonas calidirosea]CEK13691.1 hypothetical protein CWRG_00581 [Chthonomonas calidirosea]
MTTERVPQSYSTADPSEAFNTKAATPARGFSLRAVLLGLLLTIPATFWTTVIEVRWYSLDGTCLPLFIMPIFFLFWLVLLNRGLKSLKPGWALSQQELLLVYIILVVGTVMAAHDMLQNLFGSIGHASYFATPENHWKTLFFPLLPNFWLVRDPVALKGFYRGDVSPYDPHYWVPFIAPLFWWLLFIGTLIGICLCLNVLIRTRWSGHERLAFPIVELPVALTSHPQTSASDLLASRAMWTGFLLAAILDLINGMHNLYPSWPFIPILKLYNIGQYFTSRPWNAIRDTNISMYPFAIGLAYFVPLDLSFSCWFFFVARKLFQVFGAITGLDGPGSGGFPYFPQQASGAWIAWGLTVVWALRGQFRHAWRVAFQREPLNPLEEPEMVRHYRGAFFGLAIGTMILAIYSWRINLSPWVAILFFGLYFLLAITITRARAELGTPHEIYFVNPRLILVTLFGSQTLGAQNLTDLSVMYWFNRGYRCHPMPNQLEAMRMGEMARIRQSAIITTLVIAFIWGALVACWANIHVTFTNGATAKCIGFKVWVGGESYNNLQQWLQTPARVDIRQISYLIGGFLLVLFLRLMRGAFLWWPFHPAGYALAVSFAMDYFWFCFFIAWLVKFFLVRAGGMKAYQAAIPFFLGLILGDYVMGASWALFGAYNHLQAYKIYI